MQGDPRSHGLWEATAPPAPPAPPLRGDAEAEVAVIGAGFTGLSAALHLAEAGRSVAVLEVAEIGFGGSGRNSGLVNAGMWVMPEDLPAELGPLHGERLLDLLGNAPATVFDLIDRHGIACEAERRGNAALRRRPQGAAGAAGPRPAMAGPRRAGAAAGPRRDGQPPRHRGLMLAPCWTPARARSSRSPMQGGLPPRPCGPGPASMPAVRSSPPRTPGRPGGCGRRRAACAAAGCWWRPTPIPSGRGRRSAPSWCGCPISTLPPRRSATTSAGPSCPAARVPGIPGRC